MSITATMPPAPPPHTTTTFPAASGATMAAAEAGAGGPPSRLSCSAVGGVTAGSVGGILVALYLVYLWLTSGGCQLPCKGIQVNLGRSRRRLGESSSGSSNSRPRRGGPRRSDTAARRGRR
ncbi:hypothetical protein GGR56DRAFT_676632 [Xylariaceae sp. FL0804]|nr:hypothetical protein GGR56DRAFT_676632 [Xylariaceae sp. FL0804]